MQRGLRRAAVAGVVLTLLAAGCVTPSEDPPVERPVERPRAGATSTTEVGASPSGPNVTWSVRQDLSVPYAAQLIVEAALDSVPASPRTLHVTASRGPASASAPLPLDPDAPTATAALRLLLPPGDHDVQVTAAWANETAQLGTRGVAATVFAPVTLILNASSPYADDQNVFHTTHVVPLAPWRDESGHVLLDRAATRHGFPYDTPYNADLDSYYVHMVNDTAEAWIVDGVISHSWMILHNGTVASRAIDDVRPQANDTVELRYVRCWSTGNCEGV